MPCFTIEYAPKIQTDASLISYRMLQFSLIDPKITFTTGKGTKSQKKYQLFHTKVTQRQRQYVEHSWSFLLKLWNNRSFFTMLCLSFRVFSFHETVGAGWTIFCPPWSSKANEFFCFLLSLWNLWNSFFSLHNLGIQTQVSDPDLHFRKETRAPCREGTYYE